MIRSEIRISVCVVTGMLSRHQGWIRVCGVGVAWKDTRLVPALFSERNKLKKYYYVGPWSFHMLTRS